MLWPGVSVASLPMDESGHSDAMMMNDLLGTQAAACDAYAFFLRETGAADKAPILRRKPPVSGSCWTPFGGTRPKAATMRFSSLTAATPSCLLMACRIKQKRLSIILCASTALSTLLSLTARPSVSRKRNSS